MESEPILILRESWIGILEEVTPPPDSLATALIVSIGPQWGSVTAGTTTDQVVDESYFDSRDYYPYTQEFDLSHDLLLDAANGDIRLRLSSGALVPSNEGDDAFNEPVITAFRDWALEYLSRCDHRLQWLWIGDHDRSLWTQTRLTRRCCQPQTRGGVEI